MRRARCPTAIVLAAVILGGCVAEGFGPKQAETDNTILTSAIGDAGALPTDADQLSDEATIRNAVTSADIELLRGAAIPWANVETGSRGAISSLVEETTAETLCRRFTTSRERFDGVALYRGEACMVGPGAWQMKDFAPF